MAYDAVGKIYIPAEDWYEFLNKYVPDSTGEVRYGKPAQPSKGGDIIVDYACSSEVPPESWNVVPEFLK